MSRNEQDKPSVEIVQDQKGAPVEDGNGNGNGVLRTVQHIEKHLKLAVQDGHGCGCTNEVKEALNQFPRLREEVEKLHQNLEERKVLDRAKGIVMKLSGATEEDAHLRLQNAAKRTGKKLSEVARGIIDANEIMFIPTPE